LGNLSIVGLVAELVRIGIQVVEFPEARVIHRCPRIVLIVDVEEVLLAD
jgi:hypothetical protein